MISVQNVTEAFGPKKLFEDVDVAFPEGRRYGLTGPNGAGKSTFMRILSGDEEPDTGTVFRPKRLGMLRQDHFRYEGDRVIDVVLMGNLALWKALKEKEDVLAQPDISEEDGHRLAELEAVVGEEDGYEAESQAAGLLQGLGIDGPWHDQPMKSLPGGLKLRVPDGAIAVHGVLKRAPHSLRRRRSVSVVLTCIPRVRPRRVDCGDPLARACRRFASGQAISARYPWASPA